ncbi:MULTISPECIES: hypothetical protein [Streptomyces]|jgi:hypothetical protein|uniref:hypothetical protein n=1 Tax=Streptomyces TaxID=1883 RepID=UPI000F738CB8|nr:hypothetical protein [Streptomyces sp. WAC05292]RSS85129.1 hypothetical protein EF903_22150 [Streptomyces sp. WAC05292]
MRENEVKLRAIAAITAVRSGAGEQLVSDLLGEAMPTSFVVPAEATAAEAGCAVLEQLSEPLSALVDGFLLAFDALADAHDCGGPSETSEEILQQLALVLALEDRPRPEDQEGP